MKICGIKNRVAQDAAVGAGADFVGYVLYPLSPRAIDPEAAGALARLLPPHVRSVGLLVDPDDALLAHVLASTAPDMVQLHGSESPRRVGEIAARAARPVIKALAIETAEDLSASEAHAASADWLLFDAKPPKSGLPGGNGLSFDWGLLADIRVRVPWMLSGGLTHANVREAIETSGAGAVDVSSGVERSRGEKDPDRIRRFVAAAKA
ncbi:MAG: phosphoribosylanthranilate isomerase [Pseudomonadota bacterium]